MDMENQNIEEPVNFQQAFDELTEILKTIETGNLSIDGLPNILARAKFLNQYCEKKLTQIESELNDQA